MHDILNTEAATRARQARGPFTTRKIGRRALRLWVKPLAKHLHSRKPPRGFEIILARLTYPQLAAMALCAVLDRIGKGWAEERDKWKFCLDLGRAVRDEFEYAGLYAAKKYVDAKGKASKTKTQSVANWSKRKALREARGWKFRSIEWRDDECALLGDWLWAALGEMTCFTEDDRGFPAIAADHQEAFDAFVKDHLYDHPLYRPQTLPPAPWTDWENDYLGTSIRTAFVKANDPQTHAEIKAAFADGSILEHVRAVNALQAVPFTINEVTLRLLKQFGAKEFKREIAIADALVGKQFWCPLRCDRRGRLIHLSDFNPFRGDEVRSLFLFAQGKPIGSSIAWLEIAIANAYGKSGSTWTERTDWVRDNIDKIKECAEDPSLAFRMDPAPEEPYQFVAACTEYLAAETPDYETRLPIWLDATSNGLQHLAMLRRDPELAREVNLNTDWNEAAVLRYRRRTDGVQVPVMFARDVVLGEKQIVGPEAREWLATRKDKPKSIYKTVARRIHTNLTADGSNELSQFWLKHHKDLHRLNKQPVMTVSYGATPSGRRTQIREKAKKRKITIPKEQYRELVTHLEKHIWDAMLALKPTATAIETGDFIIQIAADLLDHNKYMRWVSPSGFPVSNRYPQSKTGDDQRVLLPFLGKRITISDGYTDKLRTTKTKNAVVANYVQSMDAAHLALSVNQAAERGIQAASVHDCYAAIAPDVSAFADIRHFALGVMYYHNPLEELWKHNVLDKDALPVLKLGNLDPLTAAFSEYSEV